MFCWRLRKKGPYPIKVKFHLRWDLTFCLYLIFCQVATAAFKIPQLGCHSVFFKNITSSWLSCPYQSRMIRSQNCYKLFLLKSVTSNQKIFKGWQWPACLTNCIKMAAQDNVKVSTWKSLHNLFISGLQKLIDFLSC